MPIISKTVNLPLNAKYNIEKALTSMGYDVLRWAVVEVLPDKIIVSFSYNQV